MNTDKLTTLFPLSESGFNSLWLTQVMISSLKCHCHIRTRPSKQTCVITCRHGIKIAVLSC